MTRDHMLRNARWPECTKQHAKREGWGFMLLAIVAALIPLILVATQPAPGKGGCTTDDQCAMIYGGDGKP